VTYIGKGAEWLENFTGDGNDADGYGMQDLKYVPSITDYV
jgi:hypothetical protein